MSLGPANSERIPLPKRRNNALCYAIYNTAVACLYPIVAGYLAQRYFSGKSRPGWSERWGKLPQTLKSGPCTPQRIWVHAVSAGEVVAAVPILRELRALLPDRELLLSVLTPAGFEMAEQQAKPYIDGLFYFPFDLPWVARRVVQWVRPQVFVSLESELWPNVLYELKRNGASTIMVNGRISDRNYRRVSRSGGLLFRWMLSNVDRLLMQSSADAERIGNLADLACDSPRIEVLGNSKFDQEIARLSPESVAALRSELRLPEGAPVFIAGSTRSSAEEMAVISAYKLMRDAFPDLCFVIAPRQLDRAEEIEAEMRAAGLEPTRRTSATAQNSPARHLILDTLGELANVYAVSEFAFVGNSFEPVNKGGGQNLLQPLAHGKAVLFGPKTATIRSEVALATEAGVGFCVSDAGALASRGIELMRDQNLRDRIKEKAIALIEGNRGVSLRYACAVADAAHLAEHGNSR